MGRYSYQYGFSSKYRVGSLVKVIKAVQVNDKLYASPLQAAKTVSEIIANNLNIRFGGKISYQTSGWHPDKRKAVQKKAMRRLKKYFERVLNKSS